MRSCLAAVTHTQRKDCCFSVTVANIQKKIFVWFLIEVYTCYESLFKNGSTGIWFFHHWTFNDSVAAQGAVYVLFWVLNYIYITQIKMKDDSLIFGGFRRFYLQKWFSYYGRFLRWLIPGIPSVWLYMRMNSQLTFCHASLNYPFVFGSGFFSSPVMKNKKLYLHSKKLLVYFFLWLHTQINNGRLTYLKYFFLHTQLLFFTPK